MNYFKKKSKYLLFLLFFFLKNADIQALNVDLRPLSSGPMLLGLPNEVADAQTKLNIWGRATKNTLDVNKHYYLAARIKAHGTEYGAHKILRVSKANDLVDIIDFDTLEPNTLYHYQIGSFVCPNNHDESTDPFNIVANTWQNTSGGSFRTPNPAIEDFSFVFGSCRRYIKLAGLVLFDSGKGADRVFGAIFNQTKTDPNSFFLRLGDNVYFDPIGSTYFGQYRTLKEMRSLYREVQSYQSYRGLLANRIIFSQKDDHDTAYNNVAPLNDVANHPNIIAGGKKSFMEYQKWDGPRGDQNKLYYSFSRGSAEFFVLETREERDLTATPRQMIGQAQFEDFRTWIQNPDYRDKVKFIVNPGPFISGASGEDDTWSGFPEQQKQMLETILGNDANGNPIQNVFVLIGDGHCTHGGTYKIHNNHGEIGELTEIMSSGLKAINYGTQTDFPDEIDLLERNGLRIVKVEETPIFPIQTATESIFGKAVSLVHQNVDSVFVKMKVEKSLNKLKMVVYNQHENELMSKEYRLQPLIAASRD